MWKFLDLESEYGGFVCWLNNKIIDNHFPGEIFLTWEIVFLDRSGANNSNLTLTLG